MKVKDLIKELLNEDMDSEVVVGHGGYGRFELDGVAMVPSWTNKWPDDVVLITAPEMGEATK